MVGKSFEVGAVQSETMLTKAVAVVRNLIELSPRELQVEIEGNIEQFIEGMSVENRSANPRLIVRNNWIERIPTRGILVSTRQPVLIENNVFSYVYESGILIGGGDACEWYESSPVTEVMMRGNSFRESWGAFISITPRVFNSLKAVNSGIVVEKNEVVFPKTSDASTNRLVVGHHTDGLRIAGKVVHLPI